MLSKTVVLSAVTLATAQACQWSYKSDVPGKRPPSEWHCAMGGCLTHSCADKNYQSPIDIITGSLDASVGADAKFHENNNIDIGWDDAADCSCKKVEHDFTRENKFDCSACNFNVAVQTETQPMCTTYKLLQFHMHTKSEHTINGAQSPGEIHFVHGNNDGFATTEYLVIGIMFEVTDDPSEVHPFATKLFGLDGISRHDEEYISKAALNYLLTHSSVTNGPLRDDFFHYKGGFTTPPCTEIVQWFVMNQKIKVFRATIDQYNAENAAEPGTIFDANGLQSARPTQNSANTSKVRKKNTGATATAQCLVTRYYHSHFEVKGALLTEAQIALVKTNIVSFLGLSGVTTDRISIQARASAHRRLQVEESEFEKNKSGGNLRRLSVTSTAGAAAETIYSYDITIGGLNDNTAPKLSDVTDKLGDVGGLFSKFTSDTGLATVNFHLFAGSSSAFGMAVGWIVFLSLIIAV